jgi:proteasome accessory factor B
LHRPELSDSALVGLMTLRRVAASLGPTFAAGVDELARRLGDLPDRGTPMVVRVADVSLDPQRQAMFETLQSAQRERRRVAFRYVDKTGRESRRRVDLYGFIVSSGRIYAVGHDHARNAMRTFALDGIDAVQILPNVFPKPANFDLDRFAAYSISGLVSSESPVEVTVRFSPLVARAARAAHVVRDQRVVERSDGSVEIVYAVADPLELVRWSLGWGGEAEIVAPEDVRIRAGELAQRIADRYTVAPPS